MYPGYPGSNCRVPRAPSCRKAFSNYRIRSTAFCGSCPLCHKIVSNTPTVQHIPLSLSRSLSPSPMSLSAGATALWTMVNNGQHLQTYGYGSAMIYYIEMCRRQEQSRGKPPPTCCLVFCLPNNWPYLWDILAFYASIFPLPFTHTHTHTHFLRFSLNRAKWQLF